MGVEEIHINRKTLDRDPRKVAEKGDVKDTYYEQRIREARARREFLEEEKMTKDILEPQEAAPPMFRIRGGIDLGDINIQEERQEALRQASEDRKRQEEKVAVLTKQNDEIKERMHQTEIAHQTEYLSRQIEDLRHSMSSGAVAPKSLSEQITEIRTLAQALGLKEPTPGASDGQLTIELKKLEFSMQREAQEFERKKLVDERSYQLELRKLEQLQAQTQQSLQVEKDKLNMWTSMPQHLGSIIAKAVVDGTRQKVGAEAETPEPKTAISGYVDAGIGEAGEIPCPNTKCGQPMAIGPTARVAECAVCHTRISVRRKKKEQPQLQTQEQAQPTEQEMAGV